jgi:hypothetical protein
MISKSDRTKTTGAADSTERKALPSWLSILLIIVLLAAICIAYLARWHQPTTLIPAQTPKFLEIQEELSSHFKRHPQQMNLADKAKAKRQKG